MASTSFLNIYNLQGHVTFFDIFRYGLLIFQVSHLNIPLNNMEQIIIHTVVHMLYMAREGDTPFTIANKFNATVNAILESNAICNREHISEGTLLSISQKRGASWCGAIPYYITQPGDTHELISSRLGISHELLKKRLPLFPFTEIPVIHNPLPPDKLYNKWNRAGKSPPSILSPSVIHNTLYEGSFMWEANGEESLEYLEKLLTHRCDDVRLYSAVSLGRLAGRHSLRALRKTKGDKNPAVARIAEFAADRIRLAARGMKRVHILSVDNLLLDAPSQKEPCVPLKKGERLVVLQWHIPGICILDYVQVQKTGQCGFLPRYLYGETALI